MTNIFLKVAFGLTITTFVLLILAGILFDSFSLEFADERLASNLPIILLILVPSGILLTLTGTIKKTKPKEKNQTILGLTIFVTIFAFFIFYFLAINSAGAWVNESILFRNKNENKISINEQVYDLGALGSDHRSKRIVKIEPFYKYFNTVTKIDTSTLDKSQWIPAEEPGHIHD